MITTGDVQYYHNLTLESKKIQQLKKYSNSLHVPAGPSIKNILPTVFKNKMKK